MLAPGLTPLCIALGIAAACSAARGAAPIAPLVPVSPVSAISSLSQLPDPTRPPGLPAATGNGPSARLAGAAGATEGRDPAQGRGLADARGAAAAVAGAAGPAAAAASAVAPPPATPQLQSLQVARQGAATAVLDGQLVREGDRIGEHTIGAIDAHGLLLRHNVNHSTERLQLLGAGAKQASGSLRITRHASFTPATQPQPAPPSPPPNDATLTLAGRTAP